MGSWISTFLWLDLIFFSGLVLFFVFFNLVIVYSRVFRVEVAFGGGTLVFARFKIFCLVICCIMVLFGFRGSFISWFFIEFFTIIIWVVSSVNCFGRIVSGVISFTCVSF